MNHRRQFFDRAAADWDTLEVEETHVRLREIVAGLDIAPEAAVLDVGCGTGILLPLLRESMNGDGRVVALDLGSAILGISGLSFIGLGVQLPHPEWGAMLNYGRPYIQTASWLVVFPGLAIALSVLSANLLGDALRDLLDPRYRRYLSRT